VIRAALILLTAFLFASHAAFAKPNGLVVLLGDYGSDDYYAGAVKGTVYSKYPEARIDAITLDALPANVRDASYLLARAAVTFPAGTLFCILVDTQDAVKSRALALLAKDGKIYVAPDNGVLTLLLSAEGVEVREIKNPELLQGDGAASSFPGRDIYAPAAAALAKGMAFDAVGPVVKDAVQYKVTAPKLEMGELSGEVIHIDESGNVITNIPQNLVEKLGAVPGKLLSMAIGDETLEAPYVKGFANLRVPEWLVFINAEGNLEITRSGVNANAFLQVHDGTVLKIRISR